MSDLTEKLREASSHYRSLVGLDGEETLMEVAAAEIEGLREKYDDLIYQVATKFPSETRHETAKRYIRERENRPALVGAEHQG